MMVLQYLGIERQNHVSSYRIGPLHHLSQVLHASHENLIRAVVGGFQSCGTTNESMTLTNQGAQRKVVPEDLMQAVAGPPNSKSVL